MLRLCSKTVAWTATAGLWLLCAGLVVWAFTATVFIPAPVPRETKLAPPPSRPHAERGLYVDGASRWDDLFARRFQRPLFDPPPAAPPPVVVQVVPPPPIQVIATMREEGGGSAMIRDEKGITSTVAVGATITAGGTTAKLLQVYDDRVELQHQGNVVTVTLHTNKKD